MNFSFKMKLFLALHTVFKLKRSSGGTGRRAGFKIQFFGVWVRFPPRVLIEKVEIYFSAFCLNALTWNPI